MGNDGITAVYYFGVVAPFIEHAHVQAQHIGNIDGPAHAALVRADYHHMIGIQLQVRYIAQQPLDKLVSGLYGFESVERNGILYSGVMGVEGDDVVHTHLHQFLKGQCTVQGLSGSPLVLPAFIEERHDNGDAPGFSAHGGNDPF